jgi:cholesterol transport system auxiliary component
MSRRRLLVTPRPWLVATALLLQAGCTSNLLTSKVPAPETYRLGAPTATPAPASPASRASGLALTVARPRASTALETDRIAVVPGPSRFDYYADVRWAEPAPQMLQQNLVAALEASGRYVGVFAAPARVPAELLLDVELRHFEAVAASADSTPAAFVQVQANLVDSRRAVRMTSFVSEARVLAADNRRRSVVAAFEEANARVLADVVTRVGAAAAAPTPTAGQ